jgi:hypothetical protein
MILLTLLLTALFSVHASQVFPASVQIVNLIQGNKFWPNDIVIRTKDSIVRLRDTGEEADLLDF